MKKRIVNVVLSMMLISTMGCNACAADTSKTASNNMMNDNVGIGVMQMVKDNVQVYHSKTKKEFDRLT